MDAQFPCVAKSANLLRLTGCVFGTILDIALASAHLPVRVEPYTVGGINVHGLHLALKTLFFGKGRHHHQRVTQDKAVCPVLFVVVEVDLLLKIRGTAVEVFKKVCLFGDCFPHARQGVNDRLRVDLFLYVDGNDGNAKVFAILFVLAFPDKLRVQRRIAGIEHGFWRRLFFGDKIPEFFRGYVCSLVIMLQGTYSQ